MLPIGIHKYEKKKKKQQKHIKITYLQYTEFLKENLKR